MLPPGFAEIEELGTTANVEVALVVMRKGDVLPIHDHPGISGILVGWLEWLKKKGTNRPASLAPRKHPSG